MKPVQLELVNFGPYRHIKLNFEALEQAPLFLIGGDTGAGKSTIFDGMTIALFNTTTSERKPEEMRSTFATPTDELTKIVFHFRQGNGLYQVVRTVAQVKAKSRGTGTTSHNPTASLAIVESVDGNEIQNIATKPNDVAIAIGQLLKLNASQFKQIILLPQNEFRQFLHSKTEDKLPILKSIFGMQIFENFVNELKRQYLFADDIHQKFMNDLRIQFFESNSWSEEERGQFAEADDELKVELAGRFTKRQEQLYETTRQTKKQADDELAVLNRQLDMNKQVFADFERLKENSTRFSEEIVKKKPHYEQWLEEERMLQFANGLKDLVNKYDGLFKRVEQIERERGNQLGIFEKKQAVLAGMLAEIEALERQQTEIQGLKDDKQEWIALQVVAQEKADRIADGKRAEVKLRKTKEEKQVLDTQIGKIQSGLADLQKEKQTPEKLAKWELLVSDIKRVANETLGRLDKTYAQLEDKLKNAQKIEDDFQKEIAENTKKFELLKVQLETQKSSRRGLMVAQLRSELEVDLPCAVCGGKEHPYADVALDADEAGLKLAMNEVEKLQQEVARLEADIKQTNIRKDEEAKKVGELRAEFADVGSEREATYTNLLDKFPKGVLPIVYEKEVLQQAVIGLVKQVEGAKKKSKQQEKEIANLEKVEEQLTMDLKKTEEILIRQQTQLDTAVTQIAKIESQTPDLKTAMEYKASIEAATSKIQAVEQRRLELDKQEKAARDVSVQIKGQLTEIEKQLSEGRIELSQYRCEIDGALAKGNALIQDIDVLRTWLVKLDDLRVIDRKISAYEEKKKQLGQLISELEEKLQGKETPDLKILEIQQEEVRLKSEIATKEETIASQKFDQMRKTLAKIERITAEQGTHRVTFGELTDLYQVIKGDRGSKIKLETYVVQVYLQKVLTHANRHYMADLTGGRYQFLLSDQIRDGRTISGLDIDVYDLITGDIRGAKTLSGGETFICALSIALSLSEVVQNETDGAVINALFIDEGFGSLDQETLAKAMTALEQIGENRMVGVISHVEEMKERIGQQLLIRKLGDGSSEIEMKMR